MELKTRPNRLRYAMNLRNVRPTEIADAVGVSRAAVSLWLKNDEMQITGENLAKLCAFLRMSDQWYLHGIGNIDDVTNHTQLSATHRALFDLLVKLPEHEARALLTLMALRVPQKDEDQLFEEMINKG